MTLLPHLAAALLTAAGGAGAAQEAAAPPQEPEAATAADQISDHEQRLLRLEEENRELREQLDSLAEGMEAFELQDVIPSLGDSEYGLGPAASKVYARDQGLSIGGYGEFLFSAPSGAVNRADAQRVTTYIGYRFDQNWLFNSELELEHASTSASGSASFEFAYLDFLHAPGLNGRGGLVLVPMGIVNEMHEPTTFLPAARPQTELRIIPSTWRENGVGAFGDLGGFSYRAYVVNGLDGSGFDATGLRGGRQKGSQALADDLALALRIDWVDTPGLTVGGSFYHGDSGQDGTDSGGNPIPALGTTIAELHADFHSGPWYLRGLAALAHVDDTAAFNASTGENLAERMEGAYVELGYDLLAGSDSGQSLSPYLRYEHIDTQAGLAPGSTPDPAFDNQILTLGVNYKPIDQVVLKLDYADWQGQGDTWSFLIGYVF